LFNGRVNIYESDTSNINISLHPGGDSYFNGGNVGIGTTSPGEKLDVVGRVRGERFRTTTGGDASFAAYYFSGDSDTGTFQPANNMLGITTAGTERMRITDAGNVGIGTDSPIGRLNVVNGSSGQTYSNISGLLIDVNGTSNVYYGLRVGSSAGNDHLCVTNAGNVGIGRTGPTAKLDVNGEIKSDKDANGVSFSSTGGGSTFTAFDVYTATNGGLLRLYDENEQTVNIDGRSAGGNSYFNNGGNVGIGTASPNSNVEIKEDVNNGEGAELRVINDGTAVGTGQTTTITIGRNFEERNIKIKSVSSEDYGRKPELVITQNQNESGSSHTEVLRIDSSGNVGIGTASPSQKLEVIGDDVSGPSITWKQTNRRSGYLYSDTAGVGIYDTALNNAGIYLANNSRMDFRVNGSERMRITSDGNVGIGTTNPNAKLDIAGDVKISNTYSTLKLIGTGGLSRLFLGDTADEDVGYLEYNHISNFFRIGVNAAEKMRIDSAGNVGFGTNLPTYPLHISSSESSGDLLFLHNSNNAAGAAIRFSDNTTSTSQNGTITYRHSDSQSQGGGASFHFIAEPDTTLVLGNSTNKGRFVSYSQNSTSEVDYGFGGNVNTGMYSPSSNQVGLVASGSRKLLVNTDGVTIQNGRLYLGGTVDTNTSSTTALVLNGTEVEKRTLGSAAFSNTGDYVAVTGDTMSGNLDVDADIQANTFSQAKTGIPRSNLGSPTITEMALFDSQFTPKTTLANNYNDLTDLAFWVQTTSSSAWAEVTTYSDDQKRRFLRTNNSSVIIPNGAYKFRVEFNAKSYTYADALYMYWASQSHNTTVHIWKQRSDNDTWYQHTSSTQNVSAWPGHLWLPFSTIPWHETASSTIHYHKIRVEFEPTWSTGTYADRDILLYGGQIWGGYPSGRRTPHYYDQNGKLSTWGDFDVNGLLHVSSGTSGDAIVIIESDTDNNDENDNPQLQFKQDGGITIAKAGLTGDAGTIFTNSLGNAAYFGNDEAASVQLYTNATARLTIESGGDVGIGTTSPSAKLQVEDVNAGGVLDALLLTNKSTTAGTSTKLKFVNSTDAASAPNTNYINSVRNAASDNDLIFGTSNSDRMTIDSSGNVGIGTTSPQEELHITSTVPVIRLEDTDGGYAQIVGSNGSLSLRSDQANTVASSIIDFIIDNSEKMRIDSSGNVGIGTPSPGTKLDVISEGTAIGTTGYYYNARFTDTSNVGVMIGHNNVANGNGMIAGINKLVFLTYGTSWGERMIIDGSGNVGIGTASPNATLDVNGAGNFSGGTVVSGIDTNTNIGVAIAKGDYLYSNDGNYLRRLIGHTPSGNIEVGQDATSLIGDILLRPGAAGNIRFFGSGSEDMRINSSGDVGIGTTSPGYKLDVSGGARAGGVVTYSKTYGSLDTAGNAVAGLTTGGNGNSAGFTFTCFGNTGDYQKIVYSCYNVSGTWYTKKVIDEGTNAFDIEASANAATITFTFKSTSGTKSYTPRVTVEATGSAINSIYA